jgi:hypothetical protein
MMVRNLKPLTQTIAQTTIPVSIRVVHNLLIFTFGLASHRFIQLYLVKLSKPAVVAHQVTISFKTCLHSLNSFKKSYLAAGDGFPRTLPSVVTSTVDHPLGSLFYSAEPRDL